MTGRIRVDKGETTMRVRMASSWSISVFLAGMVCINARAEVIYVKQGPAGSGTNRSDAYGDLS
jgi:hypothetical protein